MLCVPLPYSNLFTELVSTTLIVLTTVRVFVAGTAGVTVTELRSGSMDDRQRSVPTNVDPQSNIYGKHQSC